MAWVRACSIEDVEEEDLICWTHEGHSYAIYNTEGGFFATDGLCTHQEQSLEEGLVIGDVIECPLHGGRFSISTGKALSAPAQEDLKTYAVKVEDGQIYVQIG